MPHIVITGGSQRLGLVLTKHFLKLNWRVTILTRNGSEELAKLTNDLLTLHAIDQYSADNVEPICQQLENEVIDVIVHNASLFEKDAAQANLAYIQLQKMMQIHVQLPTYLNSRLARALQRSENANIIQMTDIYTENPNEQYANYCASKAAAANMAMSLAKKMAPRVRVNCIAPGALKFLPSHDDEAQKAVLSGSLIQREAGFEPVIETIDYLIRNPFITGTTIKVDGGRSLCR